MFTRAEVQQELDSLIALIEEVHPHPYSVVTRDSVQRAKRAYVALLPDRIDRVRLAIPAQRLVAMLGDGHTMVHPPTEEVSDFLAKGGRTFPLALAKADRGWLVNTTLDPQVHGGNQLLRINGHDVDSLMHDLAGEISAELESWRTSRLAATLGTRLWTHGIRSPFTIHLKRDETVALANVAGASKAQLDSAVAARGLLTPVSGIEYGMLPGRVAYLDFRHMSATRDQFVRTLDSLFDRMKSESAVGVVVDLRRNGGGNSARGQELLSYLTDQPYANGITKDWRMSRRYREYMASQVVWWVRWLPFSWLGSEGRKYFGSPDGTVVRDDISGVVRPPENPRRLARPFCVLIGTGTFSSAMILANSIKRAKLGRLVGDPTGEPPNSFGEVYNFRLPLSGLHGQVSSALFTLDPDPSARTRGVMPDIPVVRAPADMISSRDLALERARQCALAGRQ